MTKKAIFNSKKIITSLIIGLFLSFTITALGHRIISDWNAIPVSTGTNSSHMSGGSISVSLATPVSICSYKCLFGERHRVNCTGKNLSNFNETNPNILNATFEHFQLILIMGLLFSFGIYLKKTVAIKVNE